MPCRLTDLAPKWWADTGRRGQGVIFLCPHCRVDWICIAFSNPVDGGPAWDVGNEKCRPILELWEVLYDGGIIERGQNIIPPGTTWTRSGETFENLGLSPSVDASRAGCWHGFLSNGVIT